MKDYYSGDKSTGRAIPISELEAINKELDKHTTHDKEFPTVMRVKGLVDRYKSLSEANDRMRMALLEINQYNNINNDLQAYLFDVAKWGMGEIESKPIPTDYGIRGNAE